MNVNGGPRDATVWFSRLADHDLFCEERERADPSAALQRPFHGDGSATEFAPDASNVDLGRTTSLARPQAFEPPGGIEDLAGGPVEAPRGHRAALTGVDESQIQTLPLREQSLLRFMLARDELRRALTERPGVELRATGDTEGGFLSPLARLVLQRRIYYRCSTVRFK